MEGEDLERRASRGPEGRGPTLQSPDLGSPPAEAGLSGWLSPGRVGQQVAGGGLTYPLVWLCLSRNRDTLYVETEF